MAPVRRGGEITSTDKQEGKPLLTAKDFVLLHKLVCYFAQLPSRSPSLAPLFRNENGGEEGREERRHFP